MKMELHWQHDSGKWRVASPSGHYRECEWSTLEIGRAVHKVALDYSRYIQNQMVSKEILEEQS